MKGQKCECRSENCSAGIVLGDFEFGIIKRKARQLVGRAGFRQQDVQDLEQELMLRLIQSLRKFDPEIAHQKSFVTAVVERAVAKILRDANAGKRDFGDMQSLEVLVTLGDEEPTRLSNTMGNHEYNRRRGRHPRTAEELQSLASDLEDVIRSLPADEQRLAVNLKTDTIAAAARKSGIPRTTLNDAVRRLETRFRQSHVDDHL